jgi:hypothetical protein
LGVLALFVEEMWIWGEIELRDWITHCITMVRFSILVNGFTVRMFLVTHGLWQGDPLLPLLFVVVMEPLSKMMAVTVDVGLLFRFSVGSRNNEELAVYHLLFADDTLILCDANFVQLRHLRCIFLCFEAISD